MLRFLLAAAIACCLSGGSLSSAERLNVVVIMADDVGYECFGCYGSQQYATPRIDRLGSDGVRFTEAHSQPLCTPSRIKLMTGRSNAENYVAFSVLDREAKTIGQYFKEAGYATAIGGKWQLLGAEHYGERFRFRGSWPEECGFDRHCLWQVDRLGLRFWDPLLRVDGENRQFADDDYGPTVVNDYLCRFIEERKAEPFFIYYPMILVHNPFLPTPNSDPSRPRKKAKGYHQENFEDMVAYMDEMVGNVHDQLVRSGVAERTLLLFMGDNGTNKAIVSKLDDRKIVGGKGLTSDRGTHVPLIASLPGRAKQAVNSDLIDFTDILPTSLDAAGVDQPSELSGISFLPQILGQSGSKREFAYCYYWPRPERGEPSRFVHDGKWKLYADGRLYNTDKDVDEKTVVEGRADVRRRLEAALKTATLNGKQILQLGEPRTQPEVGRTE